MILIALLGDDGCSIHLVDWDGDLGMQVFVTLTCKLVSAGFYFKKLSNTEVSTVAATLTNGATFKLVTTNFIVTQFEVKTLLALVYMSALYKRFHFQITHPNTTK